MMIPKERKTRRARQLFDAPEAKPPYRVPPMAEIAAVPWNGLTVVSTFSGCGGSCLGYRMAGYKVLWSNEFLAAAQDSYRANMAAGTILDPRDVRDVTAAEILESCGLDVGDVDLFDGSPPCQAFSTAGKRERGWGSERKYANGKSQRNEEMFYEYTRLLEGLMPRAFVAENVSGLVKGAAKGFFIDILRRLKRPGYRVEARVVDAQWLGVPQQRQRVIFVGVRDDLGLEPAFPAPLPYRYSVRDALPHLGRVVEQAHGWFPGQDDDAGDGPSRAIRNSNAPGHQMMAVDVIKNSSASFARKHNGERRSGDEVSPAVMARRPNLEVQIAFRGGSDGVRARKVGSIDRPAHAVTADGYGAASRSQVAIEFRGGPGGQKRGQKRGDVDEPAHAITATGYGSGPLSHAGVVEVIKQGPQVNFRKHGHSVRGDAPLPTLASSQPLQFEVHKVAGVEVRRIANSDVVPDNVAASIDGYAVGAEYDKLNPGQQSERFFNLVRPDASKPCPAITAGGANNTGGAPGGTASICHPTEKRKFTIAELRALCAFPPDFVLTGSYSAQWERLGNSVPPLMMRAIAEAVRDRVLLPARAAAGRSSTSTRRGSGSRRG